jgi:hypothetical protein
MCDIAFYVKRCRQFFILYRPRKSWTQTISKISVAVRGDKFLHSKRLRQMSDRRRFSVSLQVPDGRTGAHVFIIHPAFYLLLSLYVNGSGCLFPWSIIRVVLIGFGTFRSASL